MTLVTLPNCLDEQESVVKDVRCDIAMSNSRPCLL